MTLLEKLQRLLPLSVAASVGPWQTRSAHDSRDLDPDSGADSVGYAVVLEGPGWYSPASHPSPLDCEPGEYREADGGPGPFICTTGHCPDEDASEADVPNAGANADFIAEARNVLMPENLSELIKQLSTLEAVLAANRKMSQQLAAIRSAGDGRYFGGE